MNKLKPLSGRVVCVFGLPCSGKTSLIRTVQASSRELIAYISSGDIARKLSDEKIMKHMAKGNLFPHEEPLRSEIYNLIHKRRSQGSEIIFLDGMPRFDKQVQWLVENQFAGTTMEGCFIKVIGENLDRRAGLRMRDDQDEIIKFNKKIEDQQVKIYWMEKLIARYGMPYYTIVNSDLATASKDMAKRIGLKK